MNPSNHSSQTASQKTFTLASRASRLAKIQTSIVQDALVAAHPSHTFKTSFMSTSGDANKTQALYLLGGKALWTKELEVALKDGQVDLLVHSLKDVPTVLPDGCDIGAILEREDPVDCLVVKEGLGWKTLEELPNGSVVGSSSVRRVAQLKRKFPGLVFQDVRGNLDTRLAKLDAADGPYTALILAKAGLVRLAKGGRITCDLTAPTFYHAVGQGALAIEIRSDDSEARQLCRTLTHRETEWKCLAERACLRVLEGGCSVPVGVHSFLEARKEGGKDMLTVTGSVTSLDGEIHVEHTVAEEVGSREEAEWAGVKLARVLLETGAKGILEDIRKDRERKTADAE